MRHSYEEWEINYLKGRYNNYPFDLLVSFVEKLRAPKKILYNKLNVLDLGCGAGSNTWYLSERGFKVFALDGAKEALYLTKRNLKYRRVHAYLIRGDFVNLPFKDNKFYLVIDRESVSHNTKKNIVYIFNEIYRILNTNGYYIGFLRAYDDRRNKKNLKLYKKTTYFSRKSDISFFIKKFRIVWLGKHFLTRFIGKDSGFSEYIVMAKK